ncbi:MAG: hypothetical protein AYP45_00570 [Candidatus Brocadia carolinensis]|uniref:Phage head morphogenesis domain-containing protein n=1 Tax=Candidatus Brocadia carolinensis TaxID=1004156 RepID=A0A1V4AXS3_9BACT|nr:MAG: hypothetical protein AYP45_00570 [Candidatus Brocadia caroliniensis]
MTLSSLGRKKKEPAVTHLKEIAYVFYSTTNDDNTCDVCRELEGRHLLPNHKILQQIKPPHPGCKNPAGCRCTLVYVTRDEDGSAEIESLLKKTRWHVRSANHRQESEQYPIICQKPLSFL